MHIFDGKVLDAYGVLGLQSDATDAEVKSAYRKLSMQYHPDFNADNEEWAKKKMQGVNAAYDEIVGRRNGTFKPSNGEYQSDDDSRPDLKRNGIENKISSNRTYNGAESDDYFGYCHGNTYSYDLDPLSDFRKLGVFDSWLWMIKFRQRIFYSSCSSFKFLIELGKYSASEENSVNKLISIYNELANLYYDYYVKLETAFISRNKDEFTRLINYNAEIETIVTKKLNEYLDEEMNVIKSAVSLEFTDVFAKKNFQNVETCIYLVSYFKKLINQYIKKYISYNNQEEYNYVYDRIVEKFNFYLSQNKFKIKDLGAGIKSYKFRRFLDKCCKEFNYSESGICRGISRR